MTSAFRVSTHHYAARDGVALAWHEMGEGRPIVLIHGLFSNAEVNWIKFGHARTIAERGFRLILPDLRAHGHSGKPHDPEHYPPEILPCDSFELIERLELEDFDLGGYSLGARTAARMVIGGAKPRRLILGGMGLEGMLQARARAEHFRRILTGLGSFAAGTPQWMAEAFLKTTQGDPEALLPLLDSFVDTSAPELGAITPPTLVFAGADDRDNGSARALAARLPSARYAELPGNHMSVVTRPEFGIAIADFLAA
ncbi:MAG TPA: alpha/beta fold hydrolase [Allosphingosinicella sp.]|nr:alpha/beta fold hydrolase [Allosphingosinicella sp.]